MSETDSRGAQLNAEEVLVHRQLTPVQLAERLLVTEQELAAAARRVMHAQNVYQTKLQALDILKAQYSSARQPDVAQQGRRNTLEEQQAQQELCTPELPVRISSEAAHGIHSPACTTPLQHATACQDSLTEIRKAPAAFTEPAQYQMRTVQQLHQLVTGATDIAGPGSGVKSIAPIELSQHTLGHFGMITPLMTAGAELPRRRVPADMPMASLPVRAEHLQLLKNMEAMLGRRQAISAPFTPQLSPCLPLSHAP